MTQDILDIIKRLDVKENVVIRVMDEATGEVVQEYSGHNAATNSMLTGIAHYLIGDGVFNQGGDVLSLWVPQYMSLGTMGLTSQESEEITVGEGAEAVTYIVPKALGYTPVAPDDATAEEKELNVQLRFSEYINQLPGFGADGYDDNSNNNRDWFGLGYPYSLKPDNLTQNFYTWNGTATDFTLSTTPISIVSVTLYPGGVVDQDLHNTVVDRIVLQESAYSVSGTTLHLNTYSGIPASTRVAVIYTYASKDAANCELINSKIDKYNNVVPTTLRSTITFRDMVHEINSELPNTIDVVYSAMISTGALKSFRGDRDYIYITEAGLWSKPGYDGSGDNGLLAGYRITPSNFEVEEQGAEDVFVGDGTTTEFLLDHTALSISSVTVNSEIVFDYRLDKSTNKLIFTTAPADHATIYVLYKTTNSWMDMRDPEKRHELQRSILRVGINQVVQVVWKLQLGGLEQLGGIRSLYPSQYPEEVWEIV
ncbi:MAG: hypothetical protein J5725_01375 [Bacteroidales bacterium]|nr:hypothetical protein [Bacteroidales bacterium]